MNAITITILTATYNRDYILPDLYDSLKGQTCKDFIWMIIDDGSSDNTEKIVKNWIDEENDFNIIYKKKHNGGKHRAINFALDMIDTEYVFLVDSDDHLTFDAIEKVIKWLNTIDDSFAGVAGKRGYDINHPIGRFPSKVKPGEYIDALNTERRKKHLDGDKAEVYRTLLMKKYKFPEFEGEKFIAENIVWDKIALAGYKMRWFNDIIYIGNYLSNGLTKNIRDINKKNIRGFLENTKLRLSYNGIFGCWILGSCFDVTDAAGISRKDIAHRLNIKKWMYFGAIIANKIQFYYYKIKGIK